jgi:ATP/ADP translocase
MSKTKGLGFGFRRPEYINIRDTILMINPRKLLLRMLLVFLILPTSMVFVILIQLLLMERRRVSNKLEF